MAQVMIFIGRQMAEVSILTGKRFPTIAIIINDQTTWVQKGIEPYHKSYWSARDVRNVLSYDRPAERI